MTILQAIILGIVQGVTEFLPISSSGHLVIASQLLQVHTEDLTFEILIHVATLIAVIIFFWKDILKLTKHDVILLGIGTIPAVLFGVAFKSLIEQAFGSLLEVGIELVITGGLLFMADRLLNNPPKQYQNLNLKSSLIIGIWQALAILPGISRSGSTVAGALLLKIEREKAFRFSFLLSIPAILGATAFLFLDIFQGEGRFDTNLLLPYLIGSLFAFVFGLISLRWFRQVIQKAQLQYFGWYCCGLGLIIVLASLTSFL